MNRFTTSIVKTATIDAACEEIWEVVSDPVAIADITPFLHHIDDLGDGRWQWHLTGVPYPGGSFGATFTERMALIEPERIVFEPEPSGRELAAVRGQYALTPVRVGVTELHIDLEVSALLPAPRILGHVVVAAMDAVLAHMGDRFATQLMDRLGAHEV